MRPPRQRTWASAEGAHQCSLCCSARMAHMWALLGRAWLPSPYLGEPDCCSEATMNLASSQSAVPVCLRLNFPPICCGLLIRRPTNTLPHEITVIAQVDMPVFRNNQLINFQQPVRDFGIIWQGARGFLRNS